MGRFAIEDDEFSDLKLIGTTPSLGDVADYIAELSDQLAHMAASNKLTHLTALLQLAAAESMQRSAALEAPTADVIASGADIPHGLRVDFKIGQR
jgi:hypothetical protein